MSELCRILDIDRGCTPSPAKWQGHAAARARAMGSPQGRCRPTIAPFYENGCQ